MHPVPNANHYDFLAPCSDVLARAVPAICRSRPGFDRTVFHRALDDDVTAFFRRTLRAYRTGGP